MQPRTLFRTVAFAEAVTWTLLLIGLFLKYVTHTTEVGVSIAGGIHGFVFLCYAATAAFTWINQKWPARTGLLATVSAVIPYVTIPVEKSLDRRGLLAGGWRFALGRGTSRRAGERAGLDPGKPDPGHCDCLGGRGWRVQLPPVHGPAGYLVLLIQLRSVAS